jgi:hypothetical protein
LLQLFNVFIRDEEAITAVVVALEAALVYAQALVCRILIIIVVVML